MRPHEQPLTSDAPARPRAVLFSDVVGSTALVDEIGDLAWYDIVDRHARMVEAAALAHDGTVASFLGDGFMVIFEHASDAIACAERLQRDSSSQGLPDLRIGIDHGEIREFRSDWWIGRTIHIASRLTDMCQGGGIAISDRCMRLVDDLASVPSAEVRLVAIRGLSEPRLVHMITPCDLWETPGCQPSAKPTANSAP